MIQSPIPKTADAIMLRLVRRLLQMQQAHERFLKHVLSFRMRKAERASIENQLSCLGTIESFAPRRC